MRDIDDGSGGELTSTPVVDVHCHVIASDTTRYPISPLDGVQRAWSRDRPATAEQLLDQMDDGGIAFAAVVQSSTTYGYHNEYLSDSVDRYPDRMRGVCSVDITAPTAIDQLEYWFTERQMVGLRIFSAEIESAEPQADWFAGSATFPAWEWVSERGIPVCMYMKLDGAGLLRGLLNRYPGLSITLDHLSGASYSENEGTRKALQSYFDLAEYPNVYAKLTTKNMRDFEADPRRKETVMSALLDYYGSGRIVWGSNFPSSEGRMAELVQLARDQLEEYPESVRADILGLSALRLYPQLADLRNAASAKPDQTEMDWK